MIDSLTSTITVTLPLALPRLPAQEIKVYTLLRIAGEQRSQQPLNVLAEQVGMSAELLMANVALLRLHGFVVTNPVFNVIRFVHQADRVAVQILPRQAPPDELACLDPWFVDFAESCASLTTEDLQGLEQDVALSLQRAQEDARLLFHDSEVRGPFLAQLRCA